MKQTDRPKVGTDSKTGKKDKSKVSISRAESKKPLVARTQSVIKKRRQGESLREESLWEGDYSLLQMREDNERLQEAVLQANNARIRLLDECEATKREVVKYSQDIISKGIEIQKLKGQLQEARGREAKLLQSFRDLERRVEVKEKDISSRKEHKDKESRVLSERLAVLSKEFEQKVRECKKYLQGKLEAQEQVAVLKSQLQKVRQTQAKAKQELQGRPTKADLQELRYNLVRLNKQLQKKQLQITTLNQRTLRSERQNQLKLKGVLRQLEGQKQMKSQLEEELAKANQKFKILLGEIRKQSQLVDVKTKEASHYSASLCSLERMVAGLTAERQQLEREHARARRQSELKVSDLEGYVKQLKKKLFSYESERESLKPRPSSDRGKDSQLAQLASENKELKGAVEGLKEQLQRTRSVKKKCEQFEQLIQNLKTELSEKEHLIENTNLKLEQERRSLQKALEQERRRAGAGPRTKERCYLLQRQVLSLKQMVNSLKSELFELKQQSHPELRPAPGPAQFPYQLDPYFMTYSFVEEKEYYTERLILLFNDLAQAQLHSSRFKYYVCVSDQLTRPEVTKVCGLAGVLVAGGVAEELGPVDFPVQELKERLGIQKWLCFQKNESARPIKSSESVSDLEDYDETVIVEQIGLEESPVSSSVAVPAKDYPRGLELNELWVSTQQERSEEDEPLEEGNQYEMTFSHLKKQVSEAMQGSHLMFQSQCSFGKESGRREGASDWRTTVFRREEKGDVTELYITVEGQTKVSYYVLYYFLWETFCTGTQRQQPLQFFMRVLPQEYMDQLRDILCESELEELLEKERVLCWLQEQLFGGREDSAQVEELGRALGLEVQFLGSEIRLGEGVIDRSRMCLRVSEVIPF